ncbi:hypothetical protein POJ06DRAFT_246988 [Lipomyces tetrasporus]|uniref:CFEM domain-containing protein n=1 Tax=Lipomyces tetrasporus TaxID=54092 RepID=A0AAD7QXM2_9ASCO|nr:uncharacterized protein POJ06DRAFT_246988 [Lipomyces tetrasporus]KAJ8103244.1 hypothetical protein POJ06DRAFT_246988 [Lipomyces tetrasporus]
MFARSSVIFAAIAALVAGQQPPACASTCITGSLSSSGCDTATVQCLCTSQSFINAVVSCVQSTCAPSDFGAALDYAQGLCGNAGVTLSINTATFTAGGAQASDISSASESASAEASTTASSAAESSETSSAESSEASSEETSAAEPTETSSTASSAAESSVTSLAATTSGTLTSITSGGTTSASGTTSSPTSTGAASAQFDPMSISFACIGAVVVSFIAGVASFGW